MILLAILALIFIGPKELPQLARTIGRFVNQLKRSTDALKDEFTKSTGDLRPPRLEDLMKETPKVQPKATVTTEATEKTTTETATTNNGKDERGA